MERLGACRGRLRLAAGLGLMRSAPVTADRPWRRQYRREPSRRTAATLSALRQKTSDLPPESQQATRAASGAGAAALPVSTAPGPVPSPGLLRPPASRILAPWPRRRPPASMPPSVAHAASFDIDPGTDLSADGLLRTGSRLSRPPAVAAADDRDARVPDSAYQPNQCPRPGSWPRPRTDADPGPPGAHCVVNALPTSMRAHRCRRPRQPGLPISPRRSLSAQDPRPGPRITASPWHYSMQRQQAGQPAPGVPSVHLRPRLHFISSRLPEATATYRHAPLLSLPPPPTTRRASRHAAERWCWLFPVIMVQPYTAALASNIFLVSAHLTASLPQHLPCLTGQTVSASSVSASPASRLSVTSPRSTLRH